LAAIFWLGRRVTAGMVVTEDEPQAVVEDGRTEGLDGALIAADLLNELALDV